MSWIQPVMGKAVEWFRQNQLAEGQWDGEIRSWFLSFLYSHSLVLAGESERSEIIQDLCDFVEACVSPTGGIGLYPGEPGDVMGSFHAALFLGWARPRSEALAHANEFVARNPLPMTPHLLTSRWVLQPATRQSILADPGPPTPVRVLGMNLLPLAIYRVHSVRKVYAQPFQPASPLKRRILGQIARAAFWPSLAHVHQVPNHFPGYLALSVLAPWLALRGFAHDNPPEFQQISQWMRQYISGFCYEDRSALYVTFHYLFRLIAEGHGDREECRRLDASIREVKYRKGGWVQHTSAGMNIFDTGLAVLALREAGVERSDPMLKRATDFLRAAQNDDGAWSWAYSAGMGSRRRPADMDDTGLSCMALAAAGDGTDQGRMSRGVEALLSLQEPSGGMNTWSDGPRPNIVPISVTSRAILAFRASGMGVDHLAVQRGCEWILKQQESEGYWVDYWLARFIYGTATAIDALVTSGYLKPGAPALQRAVKWLLSRQNPDGGWGEDFRGNRSASSAEHTGFALHALCLATREEERPLGALRAGARWLADRQRPDGSWECVYLVNFADPTKGFADSVMGMVWPLLGLSQTAKVLAKHAA